MSSMIIYERFSERGDDGKSWQKLNEDNAENAITAGVHTDKAALFGVVEGAG